LTWEVDQASGKRKPAKTSKRITNRHRNYKKKNKFRFDNKKQAISMHKNVSKTSKQAQELHKMAIKRIICMSDD
jgi:hypothetical protein